VERENRVSATDAHVPHSRAMTVSGIRIMMPSWIRATAWFRS